MELKNIITRYCYNINDKSAFSHFQKAELFLRQKKIGDAIKELEFLNTMFPKSKLIPLVNLRLATLNFRLKHYDKALQYAFLLNETEFADRGIILAGQIYEMKKFDIEKALLQYMKILNDYSFSIYYEPVRYHVRKIQKTES